jgi:ABC-type transport system involved in cytochrome bd biosynthesis fused ATPase/permease subunit
MVLLDEPTAHLDAARENELREVLAPWLEGRTVVMAAHRGGLVGRVDRTLTLVSGQVVAGQAVSTLVTSSQASSSQAGAGASATDDGADGTHPVHIGGIE